jgi:hypothetical protein
MTLPAGTKFEAYEIVAPLAASGRGSPTCAFPDA